MNGLLAGTDNQPDLRTKSIVHFWTQKTQVVTMLFLYVFFHFEVALTLIRARYVRLDRL